MTGEDEYLQAPLFIKELGKKEVDVKVTPFVCNIGGRPVYCETLPTGVQPIELAPEVPEPRLGNEYKATVSKDAKRSTKYGDQTKLTIEAELIEYQPMRATRDAAAAFGMTLIERGQGLRLCQTVQYLQHMDYEYGMFAGHMSPYSAKEPSEEINEVKPMGVVGTDLEHHGFPHVFASVDPQLELVISVGRYWPKREKIYLADLWVPRGHALYVPANVSTLGQPYLNLHGNRNSALACWHGGEQTSIKTQTLLKTEGAYFHWFWNKQPTSHPLLPIVKP